MILSVFIITVRYPCHNNVKSWWRPQMETFSALLSICAGNSPVPGEFPTQRPVTQSFDVYFDLRLNKRLCKQSWGWWFETLLCPLWRHSNVMASEVTDTSIFFQQLIETNSKESITISHYWTLSGESVGDRWIFFTKDINGARFRIMTSPYALSHRSGSLPLTPLLIRGQTFKTMKSIW